MVNLKIVLTIINFTNTLSVYYLYNGKKKKMKTIKAELKDLDEKQILNFNESLLDCKLGEFVRIKIEEDPSLVVIYQYQSCYVDDEYRNVFTGLYERYNSSRDFYPVFYYAITRLMYHSIMFLRHLPVKRFNRFVENDRIEREINNINLLLAILKDNKNYSDLLGEIWINNNNTSINHLINLAKEYETTNWEITEIRQELFDILTDRLQKIEFLYKRKKYKKIRDIGYEIHNLPEMLCKDMIFPNNFK